VGKPLATLGAKQGIEDSPPVEGGNGQQIDNGKAKRAKRHALKKRG